MFLLIEALKIHDKYIACSIEIMFWLLSFDIKNIIRIKNETNNSYLSFIEKYLSLDVRAQFTNQSWKSVKIFEETFLFCLPTGLSNF